MSLEKSRLSDFIGALTAAKVRELDRALSAALALPHAPKS
jgi:mRNA-degrading endonuclease toxin of MazEF toxin-antitoxin module